MLISQNIILLTNFQGTVKCPFSTHQNHWNPNMPISCYVTQTGVYIYPVDHLWNQQVTTDQVFYGPVYYFGVN